MRDVPPDLLLNGMLAVVVILEIILVPVPFWYVTLVLLALVTAVSLLARVRRRLLFPLVCSGALLIVACAAANIGGGLIVGWILAGRIAASGAGTGIREKLVPLALYCTVTLAAAALIQAANHVLLPLIVLAGTGIVFVATLAISDYRFRKAYSGALP